MTVVNLRGVNGAGKTYVVKALLGDNSRQVDLVPWVTKTGKPRAITGHISEDGICAVGRYDPNLQTSGCDAIKLPGDKNYIHVMEAVRQAMKVAPHVIFEGVYVSATFGRYLEFSKEIGGMVWAYLDTPWAVCRQRILTRNGKTFNETREGYMSRKRIDILRTGEKALDAGEQVVIIDHTNAVAEVRKLFV